MATDALPCSVLCNRESLATFLRLSRVGNCRWFKALVTQPSSVPCVLVTKRAARLWTISRQLTWYFRYGSQAALEYSNIGLTSVVLARLFISSGHECKFRLMKPRVLFALFLIFDTCAFQFRVFVMVTPRYGCWSNDCSM